jgi:hypothetical protein
LDWNINTGYHSDTLTGWSEWVINTAKSLLTNDDRGDKR